MLRFFFLSRLHHLICFEEVDNDPDYSQNVVSSKRKIRLLLCMCAVEKFNWPRIILICSYSSREIASTKCHDCTNFNKKKIIQNLISK